VRLTKSFRLLSPLGIYLSPHSDVIGKGHPFWIVAKVEKIFYARQKKNSTTQSANLRRSKRIIESAQSADRGIKTAEK
jgi:hypothetical protein